MVEQTKKPVKRAPRKKGLQNIKDETKAAAYEDACRSDIMEEMLMGQWSPARLLYYVDKYSNKKSGDNKVHNLPWVRARAGEAANVIREIQKYSTQDKEQMLDDITMKLYKIYDIAMNRTGINRRLHGRPADETESYPDPDLKSAILALNSLAKLHGLFDDSTTINISPTYAVINKLTQDELMELRTTGKLPQSVLSDWKSSDRQEIPDMPSYNKMDTPVLAEFCPEEK